MGTHFHLIVNTPEPTLSDSHLFNALRYVALNPVRAGLCGRPEYWQWGSFRALAGLEKPPSFLDVPGVLNLFASDRTVAQSAFRDFVDADDDDEASFPLVRIDGA